MARFIATLLILVASFPDFAQKASDSGAGTERASPLAIGLFLVLFIGSGVAYAIYLWWDARKRKREPRDE